MLLIGYTAFKDLEQWNKITFSYLFPVFIFIPFIPSPASDLWFLSDADKSLLENQTSYHQFGPILDLCKMKMENRQLALPLNLQKQSMTKTTVHNKSKKSSQEPSPNSLCSMEQWQIEKFDWGNPSEGKQNGLLVVDV